MVLRIRAQAGNVTASGIADVQILITRNVSGELLVPRHVEAVTGRTADAVPVRSEAAAREAGNAVYLISRRGDLPIAAAAGWRPLLLARRLQTSRHSRVSAREFPP